LAVNTRTYAFRLRIGVICAARIACRPKALPGKPESSSYDLKKSSVLPVSLVAKGVHKIRLTGGEPTVRQGVEQLVASLNQLPGLTSLGMTTNGVTLQTMAKPLKQAGISSLNISLDTLQRLRFQQLTHRDHFQQVMAGIEAALSAGFETLKLNVVVMKGVNDDELLDFIAFVADKPLNVRFIEFMPFKNNHWNVAELLPYSDMRARIQSHYQLIPLVGHPSEVAKDFRIPGVCGAVSFITSMTDHFCDACSRLRLTADGALKTCLLGEHEYPLRDALRAGLNDEGLVRLVNRALQQKPLSHADLDTLASVKNRTMIEIGG
jgi:cyclic pyranopterin phosphate synthase